METKDVCHVCFKEVDPQEACVCESCRSVYHKKRCGSDHESENGCHNCLYMENLKYSNNLEEVNE